MSNYDYEQAVLVGSLAYNLGLPMQERELQILRKNTLDLTSKLIAKFAKRDLLHKEIRIAQLDLNEALELKLLRELNELEKS